MHTVAEMRYRCSDLIGFGFLSNELINQGLKDLFASICHGLDREVEKVISMLKEM